MIFRQLFDAASSTLTYLLGDPTTGRAVLIDCVYEQHLRDLALIRELGLTLCYTLETHVHADHVTGAWLMKEATGSQIGLAAAAGAQGADWEAQPGDILGVGSMNLEVRSTPGHTNGCLTYVVNDARCAFTGDALLIRGAGRTDFQGGSAHRLYTSVQQQIFSLDDEFLLYPAHDYSGRMVTSVKEEKAFNPRLALHVRQEDFVGYMEHLGLPHPKKMEEAVPANLECGRPKEGRHSPALLAWGPAVRTYAGVWQVEPEWVASHRDDVTIIDVREKQEAASDLLGTLSGSVLVPLSECAHPCIGFPVAAPWSRSARQGARSAIAAQILEQAGVEEVANLRGGMQKWRDLGYPLDPQ